MHISMYIHFVHACALLMSLGTTCDLGKGKVTVLMWQLMPFPPLQMVLIGNSTAQGQLLGVTAKERESERGERMERRRSQKVLGGIHVCVCRLCFHANAICLLTSCSLSYLYTSYTLV